MKKITVYYFDLLAVIVVQFAASVIGKSMAVQQSVSLVSQQKELADLERRESELIQQLATQTSLEGSATTTEFIAITKPLAIEPKSLVATR